MSEGYRVLSLDELEPAEHRGSNLLPIRHTLGFRPAGINAWAAGPGGQLIPPHEEDSGNEELYVVVRGRARFTVGEETADAPAGTLVFVGAGAWRTAVAEEPGTIVLAVGATVGEPFYAHGWDSVAVADSLRKKGRPDEARAVMQALVDQDPSSWGHWYNAACFDALAGDADAAFAHLRRAFELNEREVREYMGHDTDLDSIRDDPRFAELLA